MKLFTTIQEPMVTYQLIPHKQLKNYLLDSLYKGFSDFYIAPEERLIFGRKILISYITPISFNYKMYISKDNISFFYTFPEKYKEHFLIKLKNVFDHATLKEVNELPFSLTIDCLINEVNYKKHSLFSLNTDKDTTYPLASICNITDDMNETDYALINVTGIPVKRINWDYKIRNIYNKFKLGKTPRRFSIAGYNKLQVFASLIEPIFKIAFDALGEVISFGGGKKRSNNTEFNSLHESTKRKLNKETVNTNIDVVTYSEDENRKYILMNNILGCYSQIAEDNELIGCEVETTERKLNRIKNGYMPIIKINGNILSVSEFRKLTQIATSTIQSQYPQIEQNTRTETKLPLELFEPGGIPFCKITERGTTRTAFIPIHDHDMLCMPHLSFGQMRVGKSEGFGNNMAYGFIMKGFSSFVLETNDGLSLDALRDSLPLDYPDEKIIEVDLGNTMYPVALSWNDSISRELKGNYTEEEKEINQLIIAEKLTGHLKCFIDNLAKDEFSDRMEYYLTASGRAVLSNPNNSLLDVLLALTSPSYREKLMKLDYIKEQSEVYQILDILQNKTLTGSITHELTPIMTRLNVISGNTFISNCLLQEPKLDSKGNPKLDFRKYMDNPEGGYGYCVLLRVPKAQFGGNKDVVNRLASFLMSKLWMCALSRIDTPKNKRRPFCFIADEPHQYIEGTGELYKEAGVESSKYRMKLIWMAHSLGQFGEFKSALTDGGCQITAYKTKSIKAFKELQHEFEPHNYEDLYKELPKRWVAVNKILLPKSDDVPAFVADMLPPMPKIKDRSYRRIECSKLFGRPFKEVKEQIQKKRNTTIEDDLWLQSKREKGEDDSGEEQKKKVGRPAKRKPKVYK